MHISFDFDYTLADSSGGTIACADYAFRELGMKTPPDTDIIKTIGLSLEKTFKALSGISETSAEATQFKALFLQHAEQVMLEHIHLYPGTRSTLEALKHDGHYVSIVSTKLKVRIEEALERDNLTHLVDYVIGGGCVKNNKPDPEGLLLAMTQSGINANETCYVGDSVSDGECALRAKVAFIALLSGQTSIDALRKWKPVKILGGVAQLADIEMI